MQKKSYTIGEVAKHCAVKIPTIRFYEQIGLLKPPPRTAGNRREYTHQDMDRLCFIRHARALGFETEDIRGMIKLSADPAKSCAQVHAIASHHLASVEKRIAQLKAMRKELRAMLDCHDSPVRQCRIMMTLADHSQCVHD